jgi:hypothetical protein
MLFTPSGAVQQGFSCLARAMRVAVLCSDLALSFRSFCVASSPQFFVGTF